MDSLIKLKSPILCSYLHSYPPILATSQPTLESSASTTQTFFSAAQKVSSAVGTVASSAGTWVSSQLSSTSPTDSAPPAPPPKEYPHSSRHPESGPGISTGNASDRSPETYTTDSTLVFATSENVPTPAQSDSGGDVKGAGHSKDVTTEHPKDTEEDEDEEDEDIGEENLVVEMEREGSGHWEEVTV